MCPPCSVKLNYHSKKREVKRIKKSAKKHIPSSKNEIKIATNVNIDPGNEVNASSSRDDKCYNLKNTDEWEQQKTEDVKSREDEMEEYLQDLLL